MRLDVLLVQWGLAPTRSKAQELLRHGEVEIHRPEGWHIVKDASLAMELGQRQQVRLRSDHLLKYVSRGGLKLEAALDHVQFDVTGLSALDVGISTGGFADCLLQRGAKQVIGVDVGSGQLAAKLRNDKRVKLFENINARDLRRSDLQSAVDSVSLCVIDVSFISLTLILPEIARLLLVPHRLFALIKPQFELTAGDLDKQGVVKNESGQAAAVERVKTAALALRYEINKIFPSAWRGGDGNQEFFLWSNFKSNDITKSMK